MQSRLLNASIETTLTLAVGALTVLLISIGTLDLAKSFDPTPQAAIAVAPPLERVIITGTRATAKVAAAASEVPLQNLRQGI